jgi:hypothetical protein
MHLTAKRYLICGTWIAAVVERTPDPSKASEHCVLKR